MFFILKIKLIRIKYLIVSFLLFFANILAYSQNNYSEVELISDGEIFNHLYDFQYNEAEKAINSIDSIQEPDRFNFLKSHYLRWYYLPIHQQNEEVLSKYIHYLEATSDESTINEMDYISINSALMKAEFNYNQGNYYKAFQNGSKVYDLLKQNLETEPERVELKFLASLYHYYYQYYKDGNPAIGAMIWFFKVGNKEVGLKWLEEVANQKSVVRTEALIYLSHIYLRLENNPERAFYYADKLHQLYPNNLKFYELLIECSLANNINNDLLTELIDELSNSDKIYFRKYGVCYDAIFIAKFKELNRNEKLQRIEKALSYIKHNGGGNHLSSLLYYKLYELSGNTEYLKQKNKLEQYKYVHTGYPDDQSNYLE